VQKASRFTRRLRRRILPSSPPAMATPRASHRPAMVQWSWRNVAIVKSLPASSVASRKAALSCHRTRRDSRSWPSNLGQNLGGAERHVAGCYGGQTRRVRNRRVGNASPRGWRDNHLDPQVGRLLAVRGPRMRAFPSGRAGRHELAKATQIGRARALSAAVDSLMDPFVQQLADLCHIHVTRAKWVIVPSHAIGQAS